MQTPFPNKQPNDQHHPGLSQPSLPPLMINAQYIKDLSFENPTPLEHAQSSEGQPEINVNIHVTAQPLQKLTYEVSLHIVADAKRNGKVLFLAEIIYAGLFTLGEGIPEKNIHPIVMIECPRLLFPYARAILAETTREGGYPPLSLHPIDFVELYRQQYQEKAPQSSSPQPSAGGSRENQQEKSQEMASGGLAQKSAKN